GVGAMLIKRLLDPGEQRPELRKLGQDGKETHQGQVAHIAEQLTTGGLHLWSIQAGGKQRRALAQLANQIRAVEVAARFAHREKKVHGVVCFLAPVFCCATTIAVRWCPSHAMSSPPRGSIANAASGT